MNQIFQLEVFLLFLVFCTSTYCLMCSTNLIKSLVAFGIIETVIILIFVHLASLSGTGIPILESDIAFGSNMADPLPQALMITAIVIGASIKALILIMSIKLFHYHGSLNWKDIFEKGGS